MLEIPESNTIAEQLTHTIKGKIIQNVYANSSPHRFAFYYGDPNLYNQILNGKKIISARAIGGLVEIFAESYRILMGDGVNVRYFTEGDKKPEKHQLFIEFEDNSAIACVVQMYGGLYAFKDGKNDNPYYLVAKDKISPLTPQFDERYFENILIQTKPTLSVKAVLATEQRIPGLGNGVLQDILFRARIHPKRKLISLSDQEINHLFNSVKQTLSDMTINHGRDTERDLFGDYGEYQTILSKNTLSKPCPVCGNAIVRQAFLGGNIYFCPTCQRLE